MVHREFDDTALFSGYMHWKSFVTAYLPERCLHQFGYVRAYHDQPLAYHLELMDNFVLT